METHVHRTVSRACQSKPASKSKTALEHDHLLPASSPSLTTDENPDTRAGAATDVTPSWYKINAATAREDPGADADAGSAGHSG
jgi:hypothetical protein